MAGEKLDLARAAIKWRGFVPTPTASKGPIIGVLVATCDRQVASQDRDRTTVPPPD